jgi:hypothetical protein
MSSTAKAADHKTHIILILSDNFGCPAFEGRPAGRPHLDHQNAPAKRKQTTAKTNNLKQSHERKNRPIL